MYRVLRECYDRGTPVDKDFLRKTAILVQEHTDTGTIQAPDKVHRLDTQTLEQIAGAEKPATVKVFNLLKALHDVVERDALAFAEHPHWQTSSHQEQSVRKSLYKAMITAGIDGVVDLAQRLMKMLRRTP